MNKLLLFFAMMNFIFYGCGSEDNEDQVNNDDINITINPWTKIVGATDGYVFGVGVAVDSEGSSYILGNTDKDLTDGTDLAGDQYAFISKYDYLGERIWVQYLGSATSVTYATALDLDSLGNVYITGYTNGDLNGNTNIGTEDYFIAKIDASNGNFLWTKTVGVASKQIRSWAIKVAGDGTVYITGQTDSDLLGQLLTGLMDSFIVRYDSSGDVLGAAMMGVSSKYTMGNAIGSSDDGEIYIAGYSTGGLDGNTLTGTRDFMLVKYNNNLTKQWTKQLGVASAMSSAMGLEVDSSGNIIVAGWTKGNLDGETKTGLTDLFITKYTNDGDKLWTKLLGGLNGVSTVVTIANAIAVDSSDNIFLTGYTHAALNDNVITGNPDAFLAKYDANGTLASVEQFGVAGVETNGYSVKIFNDSHAFIVGETAGNLDQETGLGTLDAFVKVITLE